jgi:hypothetical protein
MTHKFRECRQCQVSRRQLRRRRWQQSPVTGRSPGRASGRQDHTILPSAGNSALVGSAASRTASSPAFVRIASRPCVGRDGAGHTPDLHFGKTEIVFETGWTRGSDIKSRTAPDRAIHLRQSNAARQDDGRVDGAISGSINAFLLLIETPFNFIRAWALSARAEHNRCGYMPVRSLSRRVAA